MRFFEIVLSGSALIAAALALEFNDVPTSVEVGKTYKITYSPKDNTPTTIILRKGNPGNLQTVGTLTTSATNGEFSWTVDDSFVNGGDYALEIKQGSEDNFSGQFPLTGSDAVASSSGSASASATETTSSGSAKSTEMSATETKTTLATTTGSATAALTTGSNSTVTTGRPSGSPSSPATSGSAATTTHSGPPQSTGAAAMLESSPLALILGAVAAMAYLN